MPIRVLTLNCWNVSEPFAPRVALVRAEIERLRPDLVGLQEIVARRDGFDQAGMILDDLGYHRVFGAAHRWDESGTLSADHPGGDALGNVVASRWPVRLSRLEALPGRETGEHRSALGALVETPAGIVPFVTTHLNWRYDHGVVRERQVVALADFVRRVAGTAEFPPIVVGDLNADPDSTEIRFLCGLASLGGRSVYFQDAWRVTHPGDPGFTWDNRNRFAAATFEPDRRIDYVLVGRATADGRGRVESAALAFTEPAAGVFPSDHFGLVVDVRA